VWKSFLSLVDVDLLSIFELACDDRTRGHAFKLAVPRCHSLMKRRFLSMRSVGVWNVLLVRVVGCGSLGIFKIALEGELGDRLYAVV
jgi:hypothetical protein